MTGLHSSSTALFAALSCFERALATMRTSGKASTPMRNATAGEMAVKVAVLMGSGWPKRHSSRNMSVLKFTTAIMSKNSLVRSGHLIDIFPRIAIDCIAGTLRLLPSQSTCKVPQVRTRMRRHRQLLSRQYCRLPLQVSARTQADCQSGGPTELAK